MRKKKPAHKSTAIKPVVDRLEILVSRLSQISTALEYTAKILEQIHPQMPDQDDPTELDKELEEKP